MKGHFSFKSLAFYGVAIGSVLLLFKIVTAYGEANLKAPASIDGRYRLTLAQSPNCPKSNALVLNIQQSGIYLNGSLLPAQSSAQQPTSAEEKPSLTGLLNNQQLRLSGTAPSLAVCNSSVSQAEAIARSKDNPFSSVRIESRVEGENLAGKMTLSAIPETIEFTAQREEPIQSSEKSTSH